MSQGIRTKKRQQSASVCAGASPERMAPAKSTKTADRGDSYAKGHATATGVRGVKMPMPVT